MNFETNGRQRLQTVVECRWRCYNGCYVKTNTNFTLFIHPFKKQIESIIGKHTVQEVPLNKNVFEMDPKRRLAIEAANRTATRNDDTPNNTFVRAESLSPLNEKSETVGTDGTGTSPVAASIPNNNSANSSEFAYDYDFDGGSSTSSKKITKDIIRYISQVWRLIFFKYWLNDKNRIFQII
jgi:hypothetical protein